MIPSQEVAVWLNNNSRATHHKAQLYRDEPIPEDFVRMPTEVKGRFIGLPEADAILFGEAQKRVMILNQTQVRYLFSFSEGSSDFVGSRV